MLIGTLVECGNTNEAASSQAEENFFGGLHFHGKALRSMERELHGSVSLILFQRFVDGKSVFTQYDGNDIITPMDGDFVYSLFTDDRK